MTSDLYSIARELSVLHPTQALPLTWPRVPVAVTHALKLGIGTQTGLTYTFGATAIDRLGRSVADVTRTIADLGERRITLRVLREGVDTATPTGRAIAAIMASLAELELVLGRERRAASRESRRARHLPATKPPKLSPERQEQLRRVVVTGEPVHQLAEAFGIGRATAYRYLSSSPT